MVVEVPDPDWFLDNVVVPSGPERAFVGPARRRQAGWDAVHRSLDDASSDLARGVRLARDQGFVLAREQARAHGVPDARIRSLLRLKIWSSPRRGVLCVLPAASERSNCPEIQAAAVALVRPGTAVSHLSAGAMHGVPLFEPPRCATLTVVRNLSVARIDARIHAAALPSGDVTTWFGVPVTSVARTVVDVSRVSGCAAGLVIADAALRERLVSRGQLDAALARYSHWPGGKSARKVVALASPLAESPLESLTRLCLHDGGIPAPKLQRWVWAGDRRYRVDLLWRREKVIVEADGRVKYRPRPGAKWSEVLWSEKQRQEHLERAGFKVVRVSWADVVHRPDETVARVLSKLAGPAG